jgi:hypothetical protein
MSLFKITEMEAKWVCINCGSEQSVLIDDLKAEVSIIVFPVCSECKAARMTVCCVSGSLDHCGELTKQRHAIIQSLHRRLVQNEKLKEGLSKSDIPKNIHDYASDDLEIEAPLPFRIRDLMEAKEKEKKKKKE